MLSERIEELSKELRSEGKAEGLRKGLREGKAEGLTEGKAEELRNIRATGGCFVSRKCRKMHRFVQRIRAEEERFHDLHPVVIVFIAGAVRKVLR